MTAARGANHRHLAGRFIVLEGIDGSGTTTQAQRLVATLVRAGHDARFTCEPSGGPHGRQIRQLLDPSSDPTSRAWDALALLFAADRLDHVAREIRPALANGAVMICDRYDLSSLAYQSATAPAGVDPVPWIRAINQRAPRPDLTLVLDVDPDVAEARRARRAQPAEIFEHRELQRRLAQLYARAEELVPGDRLLHIDSAGGVQEVGTQILELLSTNLLQQELLQ